MVTSHARHNVVKRIAAIMGRRNLFAGVNSRRICSGRDPLKPNGFTRMACSTPYPTCNGGVPPSFYLDVVAVYNEWKKY